ncbi:MAG: hypothetical protein IPG80_10370 [Anaerolineales bacterium]|uniref:hypothetical protein n=1 Tax=Candidatus Villigracilis vicinus TaxID=3140679 RepID=UPI0031375463|nr:hypothetical protein [Anaerolineales bacterium]
METYTLGLALEDFLPVIFSSIGLYFVSRMVKNVNARLGQMATIGFILVSIGGFLKATWKLTMAATNAQTNIAWFDKGMFMWMSVGFTLLAFALWFMSEIRSGKRQLGRIWLGPSIVLGLSLVAILFTGFPDLTVNTWRFILLGVMTIGNVVMVVLLIQQARYNNLNKMAWLFLANIVIVFVLSGLARMPDQSIPLQWTEQLLNTFGQGAFAYAAWKLAGVISSESVTATGQVRV